VLAQEEARLLHHTFIGTEHLLNVCIRQTGGVKRTGRERERPGDENHTMPRRERSLRLVGFQDRRRFEDYVG
jgi:hypothetical protein